MNQLLNSGQRVEGDAAGTACLVNGFLGGGTQGEVYHADLAGADVALKWYFPQYLQMDPGLRQRLEMAMKRGAPSDKFLWPLELMSAPGVPGFGYVMPLRDPRFRNMVDLMKRRVQPSFRALATVGFELAHSYLQLHAKGLCYRDINFGNVFFDPDDGDIRVCDNDNVDVNGEPGPIAGTPRFMAPEIVRGQAMPSTQTDLFSLAVLLFYMLMVHHPLEGRRESRIRCLDAAAMTRLYGTEPLFIFDPDDDSNAPVEGHHDNALALWPVYPRFLRDLFTKAFTHGLMDPDGRVLEGEWRSVMVRLRDAIIYCMHCGVLNFYDVDEVRATAGKASKCWSCQKEVSLPPRIRLGDAIVMLNHDTRLYPHHLDGGRRYDFSGPLVEVTRHPHDPMIWGLKNLTGTRWVATTPEGHMKEVEPGRSITLTVGTKINFGKAEGEIRL